MKRNWDTLRSILLALENDEGDELLSDVSETERMSLIYNIELLIEANLIVGSVKKLSRGKKRVTLIKLTWDGHEFLDDIRDETAWQKVKDGANEVGSFGIDTLKQLAKGYIKTQVANKTGIEI